MEKTSTAKIIESSKQKIDVNLYVADEVFELFSDSAFLQKWDILFNTCSWSTVFQSRAFVTTWYQIYKYEYLPIVAKSEYNNKLTGLVTMAVKTGGFENGAWAKLNGDIVGAGQYDAEYQTWLSDELNGDDFASAAIRIIKKRFPNCNIIFRYLPPQTPLNWTINDKHLSKYIVNYTCSRPLLDLNDPNVSNLFNKSGVMKKLRRLKRAGKFSFNKITDRSTFSQILEDFVVKFDFRQGAMFNKNQFRDNPLKFDLLLALFDQRLLHVTAIKVDEEIMACIIALVGKGWVYLGGVNVHTPYRANYYSPGLINFLLLGQMLHEEGFKVFDLTPGGDSYKERLATSHDQVFELIIANNPLFKLKKQLRKYIDARLVRAGIRPMSVEVRVKNKLYLIRGKLKALRSISGLKSMFSNTNETESISEPQIFYINREGAAPNQVITINKNDLNALLDFDQGKGSTTKWEFLDSAKHKLEHGECSFTWNEADRLKACAWVELPIQTGEKGVKTAGILKGLYLHDSVKNKEIDEFLRNVIETVSNENDVSEVIAEVRPNSTLLNYLESFGLVN